MSGASHVSAGSRRSLIETMESRLFLSAAALTSGSATLTPAPASVQPLKSASVASPKTAVADAPLSSPTGYSQSLEINQGNSTLLGSFTDGDASNVDPTVYSQSVISWGDGKTSAATFVRTGSQTGVGSFWNVMGTHVYTTAGKYSVSISVKDSGGASTTVKLTITAVNPLFNGQGNSNSVSPNVSQTLFLGTFLDQDFTNSDPTKYASSTINWGDGTTSSAKFTLTGSYANYASHWNIYGTHKYTTSGAKSVVITVKDIYGDQLVINLTLTVTGGVSSPPPASPLNTPVGISQSLAVNQSYESELGTFIDKDASNTSPSKYSASSINWGDGTTSAATFVRTGGSSAGSDWDVYGVHTYTTTGAKHVVVTVKDSSNDTATITLTITVT